MSTLGEKVRTSLERLKAFFPKDDSGYYLAFSGGKDSVVCKHLLDVAGLKYDAHYRLTSVDPPELVQFIKQKHPDVAIDVPRYPADYKNPNLAGKQITMWNLIPEKLFPPTRIVRYCCDKFKESGGGGRMTVTGVRWAESDNRRKNQGIVTVMDRRAGREIGDDQNFSQTVRGGVVLVNDNADSRRMIEHCYKKHKTTVNPIIDWEDSEIWEYIRAENIPYCCLYDEGFDRLGCIGCPMAGTKIREQEFQRWETYKASYIRAFDKMLEQRKRRGIDNRCGWITGRDVFNWWMQYDIIPGQINLFDMESDTEQRG